MITHAFTRIEALEREVKELQCKMKTAKQMIEDLQEQIK